MAARNDSLSAKNPSSIGDEDGYVPPGFADLIPYHLRIAQEASFQSIRRAAGKSEFKPGWYTILTILSANPGVTPTELSKLCGRDRSTLTSTLNGLDTRGLITRRRKVGDQRSYGVKLTAAGERMLKKLRVIARGHDARLDEIVGKEKPLFLALLRRIIEGLGNADPTPARRRTTIRTG